MIPRMGKSDPTLVAVGGGKGGVGKSVVASNLAIACAQAGLRTVLVDADLGSPNQHTLFGIDRPGPGLQALLDRQAESLEEVAIATVVKDLRLVPGMGGVEGAANPTTGHKQKLVRHIRKLEADVVIIDVGAGVSFNVLDFYELGDLRVVVATPQLTSIQNAYCFAKGSLTRSLRHVAVSPADQDALRAASDRSATERISQLVQRLKGERPELAARVERVVRGFSGILVGNMMDGANSRHVLYALTRMMRDFLDVEMPIAAEIPMSTAIHQSVTRRAPLLLSPMKDVPSARAFRELAERVALFDRSAVRALRDAAADADVPVADIADPDGNDVIEMLIPFLRKEERVAVQWPVRAKVQGQWGPARVVNASRGGLLAAIDGDIAAGTPIELEFDEIGAPILSGIVRHSARGFHGVELDAASGAAITQRLSSGSSEVRRLGGPEFAQAAGGES